MSRQSEVHGVACFGTESDLKLGRAICVPADDLAVGSRDALERDSQRISDWIENLTDHFPTRYIMTDDPRFGRTRMMQASPVRRVAWRPGPGHVRVLEAGRVRPIGRFGLKLNPGFRGEHELPAKLSVRWCTDTRRDGRCRE
ncbi:MAG TPA: hypothetical protein DCE55_00960 [Planctomycetaceae bacterium]|nr:hypothetical protein [Planctomycetaceae bacterium]